MIPFLQSFNTFKLEKRPARRSPWPLGGPCDPCDRDQSSGGEEDGRPFALLVPCLYAGHRAVPRTGGPKGAPPGVLTRWPPRGRTPVHTSVGCSRSLHGRRRCTHAARGASFLQRLGDSSSTPFLGSPAPRNLTSHPRLAGFSLRDSNLALASTPNLPSQGHFQLPQLLSSPQNCFEGVSMLPEEARGPLS